MTSGFAINYYIVEELGAAMRGFDRPMRRLGDG